jgi:hypothetical protein
MALLYTDAENVLFFFVVSVSSKISCTTIITLYKSLSSQNCQHSEQAFALGNEDKNQDKETNLDLYSALITACN